MDGSATFRRGGLDSSDEGCFFEMFYMCGVIFVKRNVLWFPGKFKIGSLLSSDGVDGVNPVDLANLDACSLQGSTEPILLGSTNPFEELLWSLQVIVTCNFSH